MDASTILKLITLGLYSAIFGAFTLVVGRALRSSGKTFLDHTFGGQRTVASSVHFLLSLGFYLTCTSLLLWNLGTMPAGGANFDGFDVVQCVALRLGVSVFVVATFHTTNVLVLSVLNRNSRTSDSF